MARSWSRTPAATRTKFMPTIIICAGLDQDGKLINLYIGPSYVDAENAMIEAGREYKIVEGWIFNNPVPALHQYYAPEAPKRRGRPPKTFVEDPVLNTA